MPEEKQQIQPLQVERDEYGFWTHPAWPDDGDEGNVRAHPTGLKHEYWYKDGRCITSRTSWEPSTCWGQGGPLFDKHLGSAHHNPHLEDGCCLYSAGPAGAGIWLRRIGRGGGKDKNRQGSLRAAE